MDALAKDYQDTKIKFLVAYITDPHAGDFNYKDIEQPSNYQERTALAEKIVEELGLERKLVVDTMNDDLYYKYGGCPNMLYVIGPNGKIVYHNRWADDKDVYKFLLTL